MTTFRELVEDITKKSHEEIKEFFVETNFMDREESIKYISEEYDFISEQDIADLFDETEIEHFVETVDFEDELVLEWTLDTDGDGDVDLNDLGEGDCDCSPDEDDCVCPEDYYEFVPSEDGEWMDLEYESEKGDLPTDDAIDSWLDYKANLMAEEFDIIDFDGETLEESQAARIHFKRAKGQIVKKKKCPLGMKLKGKRCVKQSGTEKAGHRRLGIKLKRAKKAMGAGAKKRASIKAKITKRRVKGRARTFSGVNV